MEEFKKWVEQAERDLNTAEYLFEGKRYKEASFFSQQSAEKLLKALLIKKDKKIIRIHDLVKLGKLLNLDSNLIKDCEILSKVYIDSRYPDLGEKEYTKEETTNDIKIAKKILKWTKEN